MPMSSSAVLELVRVYLPAWQKATANTDRIDRWYRDDLKLSDKPSLAKRPTKEYKDLRDRAMTPWLKFAVKSLAQLLYAEGYRRSDQPENVTGWKLWQANGMDARQIAVHRAAIAHGLSFVTVLPGDPLPVVRGVSARKMVAFYQDGAVDDWPMYALHGTTIIGADGRTSIRFKFYDAEVVYTFDAKDDSGDGLTFITFDEHNAGVCPVVRFANDIDLDGRTEGEVEPHTIMAARINQDTLDRLIVQRFGAWVVRYATGLTEPDTDEDKRAMKLQLGVEDILVSEGKDTKFGTLPATPLDGYLKAYDTDVRAFAAITQTPPQDLLGTMINISAEALAAAEAGRTRKADERKHTFGESHEQWLRLGQHLQGDTDGAADFEAQLVWKDVESRSLAQVADAFGKMADQLHIPPEALWERIPGVTLTDVQRWKKMREDGDELGDLLRQLTEQGQPAA